MAISLRRAGVTNAAILDELGVTREQLKYRVAQLIGAGRLTSREGLVRSSRDAYVEGHERASVSISGDLDRLYTAGKSHAAIGAALNLTRVQVRDHLSKRFAAGLPRRFAEHSNKQIRDIHTAYRAGDSIEEQASLYGVAPDAVRRRMHKLGSPLVRDRLRA